MIIELVAVDSGVHYYVNSNKIVYFYQAMSGTQIILENGEKLFVHESAEDIINKLNFKQYTA